MAVSRGFNRLDPNNLPGARAAAASAGKPSPTESASSYVNQELGGLSTGISSRVGSQSLRPSQQLLGMARKPNAVQFAQQQRQGAVKATNNRLMQLAKQNGEKRKQLAAQSQQPLGIQGQPTIQRAQYGGNQGYQGGGQGPVAVTRVQNMLRQFPGLRITETVGDRDYDRANGVARGPNSFHYDRNNPAVDIAGNNDQLWRLYEQMKQQGGWRQILWQVAGHYDHIHVA